ncbi:Hypothetical protein, putative [Bodo saltans]|uniref:Uncharacterized protein n=1 Tax=Bodo saltans TaxID=75058 RepID=A0A0S4J7I2_BODSA|nr:Hypothetical protein, putative [Bodo saltans]|eukprot:CUG86017.1 Hypothetical protein, putative [Bodo saltans]
MPSALPTSSQTSERQSSSSLITTALVDAPNVSSSSSAAHRTRPAPIIPPEHGSYGGSISGDQNKKSSPTTTRCVGNKTQLGVVTSSQCLGLPPRSTSSVASTGITSIRPHSGLSPVTPGPPRGTPTSTLRITSITPPGTRRTSMFLSSIRADMGLQPPPSTTTPSLTTPQGSLYLGDTNSRECLTPNPSSSSTLTAFKAFGDASTPAYPGGGGRGTFEDAVGSGMLDSGKLSLRRRENSFLFNNGGGGGSTSVKSPGGGSQPHHTPMTPSTMNPPAGKTFIVSKRQTAFLLSISTLYGAAAASNVDNKPPGHNNTTAENDDEVNGLRRDASSASLALDDHDGPSAFSSPSTLDVNTKWARMLPTRQGDKVRLRLMSLHAGKHWAPLLLSTMLATFRERRVLMAEFTGDLSDLSAADYAALAAEGLPLAGGGISIATSGGGVTGGTSLGMGVGVLGNVSAPSTSSVDTSPNKKFVGALVQTLSDVAQRATGRHKDDHHHEITYNTKFSADHDARVSASPQFSNPFYLDDPDITGERRRKRMHLRSYICTVISFADRRTEKKDINQQFFLRHPYLELRDIKLSHIRSIKTRSHTTPSSLLTTTREFLHLLNSQIHSTSTIPTSLASGGGRECTCVHTFAR